MAVELNRVATGTFCWTELSTKDPAGARAFYSKLFGWNLNDLPISEGEVYTMAAVGDKTVGAIQKLRPDAEKMGAPSHWMNYIAVDDADKYAAKAKELGANIFAEPFDVMDAGRMAVLADPTGAMFSLWEGRKHQGADLLAGEVGSACWFELYTNDTAKATAFYTGLFGYTTETMETGGGNEYTVFLSKDPVNPREAGMMDPKQGFPPYWQPYFSVADADATFALAKELGGTEMMPVTDIPPGRFAILQDPQGAVFAILELKPR